MKTFKRIIAFLFVGSFFAVLSTPFVFMFWGEIAKITFCISTPITIVTLAYTVISGVYKKLIRGGNGSGYKHL